MYRTPIHLMLSVGLGLGLAAQLAGCDDGAEVRPLDSQQINETPASSDQVQTPAEKPSTSASQPKQDPTDGG